MSKVSGFKNKHFLALAGNLVISIFGVATMALLYRSMSKSDIGTWFLFLSFIGIADGIRSGFLSTGTVKFYSGVELDRGKKVLGSVWFIALSISLLLLLLNAIVWTTTTQLQLLQLLPLLLLTLRPSTSASTSTSTSTTIRSGTISMFNKEKNTRP